MWETAGGPSDGCRLQCHRYQPGRAPYKVSANYRRKRTKIKAKTGQLFYRGLVQRCPIPVKNLITFGSPHQVEVIVDQKYCLAGRLWDPGLHSSYRCLCAIITLPNTIIFIAIMIFTTLLSSSTRNPQDLHQASTDGYVQAALSFASLWTRSSQLELTSHGFKMLWHQLRWTLKVWTSVSFNGSSK